MRVHTIEIADRAGNTFRMEVSTIRSAGRVRDVFAGDYDRLDIPMTGIKNDDGKVGHIVIDHAFNNGSWRVLDKGFLRFNSGRAVTRYSKDVTTRDVILMNMDGTWGMKLFDYEDVIGVNSEGTGTVAQPWVLQAKDGRFSWALTDL